jgi:hypothetical protein
LSRWGLRIETIHAFSQWLLSAFPVESGLLPGTRAMEDRDRELLVREVLAQMLVEAEESGDERVLDALAHLALRMDQGAVIGFLLRCAKAIDLWQEPGAWRPPLRPRINQCWGWMPMRTAAAWPRSVPTMPLTWPRCAAAWRPMPPGAPRPGSMPPT